MSDDVKKIECDETIRMMLEYLDNELHHHDHDSMDEHLENCRSCYSRMEFEQRLKGMVKDVKDKAAPVGLNDRIKKIIKDY
jgi:anti-sigma factor (TIGR02949 family)